MTNSTKRPTHTQLMLPLLETLEEQGGAARPRDLYDAVADKLGVAPEIRDAETRTAGGRTIKVFERHIRWARQTAIRKGLIGAPQRGVWQLTEKGEGALQNARPGLVLTVFETPAGQALWAMAEDAAGHFADDAVDLLFTSPPYPVLRGKAYGTWDSARWLDWMSDLAAEWKRILKPTGSLMVNLGTVWQPGQPVCDPYIERFVLRLIDDLGYHLADRFYWHNPAKMPSPMPWVAIRRVRVKQSIEPVLWFAKTAHPKADNRRVLVPYQASTLKRYIGKAGKSAKRPSGYGFGAMSFARDNGGAIPPSLITAANSQSSDAYRNACREAGLPIHPATFPEALPEFAIKLTTEADDLVYDPFLGSGTTAAVAERLGRRWIGSDRSLVYLNGASFRFSGVRLSDPAAVDVAA